MFFRYNFPGLLWALFILIITLLPGKYIPPVSIWDISFLDKLVHAGVFAVLSFLFMRGFIKQYASKALRYSPAKFVFSIGTIYGIILETMQEFLLIDRFFDPFDAVANSLGCILGIIIFKFVTLKLNH